MMAKDFIHLNMDADGARRWLNNAKQGIGDLTPLFKGIEKDIIHFAEMEFTPNNPNSWMELKPTYREWKVKHGYPKTIGIMTGALRDAASKNAKVTISKKKMSFKLNDSMTKTKKGDSYAQYFDHHKSGAPKRKIYKWTAMRVESFIQGVTLAHINKQIGLAKK